MNAQSNNAYGKLSDAFLLIVVAIMFILLFEIFITIKRESITDRKVRSVNIMLDTYTDALSQYCKDNHHYPITLGELAEPVGSPGKSIGKCCSNKKYLEKVSRDPWGTPFNFNPKGSPMISSFGKDGIKGGSGYDSDIIRLLPPCTAYGG